MSGYVRERTLLEYLPVHRSTLWRWVKNKTFPAPQKLSDHVTVWSAQAVRQHLACQADRSIASAAIPKKATAPTSGFALRGPGSITTQMKVYQHEIHNAPGDGAQAARRPIEV